jgi:hypothetical protein
MLQDHRPRRDMTQVSVVGACNRPSLERLQVTPNEAVVREDVSKR